MSTKTIRDNLKKYIQDWKATHPCLWCGEKDTTKLTFHHRLPELKEFDVNTGLRKLVSMGKMKKEIDKCIILCRKCHNKLHRKVG